MAVGDMLEVWHGKAESDYGEQAIISSLASYLVLLRSSEVNDAIEEAKLLWQQRDKASLPFSN